MTNNKVPKVYVPKIVIDMLTSEFGIELIKMAESINVTVEAINNLEDIK